MELIVNGSYIYIFSIFIMMFLFSKIAEGKLFEGEEIRVYNNYPVMMKFVPGEKNMPLVVVSPGANSTARIFYGVHESFDSKQFLAYWLYKRGYNLLFLSYPLEVKDQVFGGAYPGFTIKQWGEQIALASKDVIQENNLENKVIAVGWSMAGRVSHALGIAAEKIKLDIELWIGLAATPPMPGLSSPTIYPKLKKSNDDKGIFMVGDKGYAVFGSGRREARTVAENAMLNGLESDSLIPREIGRTHYFGNTPINLFNHGWRYRGGEFVRNFSETIEDSAGYDYAGYPLTANITNDSIDDARHAMTDKYNWGMVIVNKITKSYVLPQMRLKKFNDTEWKKIREMVRKAPEELSLELSGNHFFFLGRKGAKGTADAIDELHKRSKDFKSKLVEILGIEVK